MDDLIPIGRFSRVTRLSIKALRHYADVGLLEPAWVDPSSGYRYYTYAQATSAEVIRVPRSLEMPLDEIREVLTAADDDVVAKVMDRHRARLEDRVAHQNRMLAFLRRLIEEEGRPVPYEVTVKEIPAQHVAVLRRRVTAGTIGAEVGAAFGALMAAVGRSGAGFAGPTFLVMTEVVDPDGGDGEVEVGIPVATPFPGDGEVQGREEPAHLVAATVHRGPYEEEGPAYAAVERWVQAHGHASSGPPREVYLTSPADTPDPADYRTEIRFPIVVA